MDNLRDTIRFSAENETSLLNFVPLEVFKITVEKLSYFSDDFRLPTDTVSFGKKLKALKCNKSVKLTLVLP